ncbi:hypothetical protein B0H34DRAFT_701517 [Crassisporium funariophilum]|nr:hypothetical protein B0H34DRAFT_701517 [Crassisporium funariophilum]
MSTPRSYCQDECIPHSRHFSEVSSWGNSESFVVQVLLCIRSRVAYAVALGPTGFNLVIKALRRNRFNTKEMSSPRMKVLDSFLAILSALLFLLQVLAERCS